MPAFSVLRIQKLKSLGAIAGTDKHNARERETPNADAERMADNRILIGTPERSSHDSIKEILAGQRVRSNAVLGVELLLSASPEFFRPESPEAAGTYNKERLEAWTQASVNWLEKTYGNRIQKATLHCDEATPHIHVVMVPLDERGKLNCRTLFGGSRQTLRDLQSDYAQAVKHLGIERGIAGGQGTHQKVSQFYALTQSNRKAVLPLAEQFDQPALPGKIARMYDGALVQLAREAATSGAKAQKDKLEPIVTALKKENIILRQQVVGVKKANSKLTTMNAELKEQLNNFRGMELGKVLTQLLNAKGPYPAQKEGEARYCLADRRDVFIEGNRWRIGSSAKGKGAIDLVMAVRGYSQDRLGQALGELVQKFGEQKTTGEYVASTIEGAAALVRSAAIHCTPEIKVVQNREGVHR